MRLPSILSGIFRPKIALDAGKEVAYNVDRSQRYEYSLKHTAIVVEDTSLAHDEPAQTDPSNTFLVCPGSNRLVLDVHPIIWRGKSYVILPHNDHRCANIRELSALASGADMGCDLFKRLSVEERVEALELLKPLNRKLKLRLGDVAYGAWSVSNIHGSVNVTMFSNRYSYMFGKMAFLISQTTNLKFLEDTVARNVFILSLIIACGVGFFLGAFFGGAALGMFSTFLFWMIK
jgi:hypothetical protein